MPAISRIGRLRGATAHGLERHAAFRAVAGRVAHDLGMHRAGVFRALGQRRRSRPLERHAAFGAVARMVLLDIGVHRADIGRGARGPGVSTVTGVRRGLVMAAGAAGRSRGVRRSVGRCGLRFFVVVAGDFWHLAHSWYRRRCVTLDHIRVPVTGRSTGRHVFCRHPSLVRGLALAVRRLRSMAALIPARG